MGGTAQQGGVYGTDQATVAPTGVAPTALPLPPRVTTDILTSEVRDLKTTESCAQIVDKLITLPMAHESDTWKVQSCLVRINQNTFQFRSMESQSFKSSPEAQKQENAKTIGIEEKNINISITSGSLAVKYVKHKRKQME